MLYIHRLPREELCTPLSSLHSPVHKDGTRPTLIVISVNIKPSEKIAQEERKSNTEEVRDDKTMQKTCWPIKPCRCVIIKRLNIWQKLQAMWEVAQGLCVAVFALVFNCSDFHFLMRAPMRPWTRWTTWSRTRPCCATPQTAVRDWGAWDNVWASRLRSWPASGASRTCSRTCSPPLTRSCPSWPWPPGSCLILKMSLTCAEQSWPNEGLCCRGCRCNANFLTHIAPWQCYRVIKS